MVKDISKIKFGTIIIFEIGSLRLSGKVIGIIAVNGKEPYFIVSTTVGTSEVKIDQIIKIDECS